MNLHYVGKGLPRLSDVFNLPMSPVSSWKIAAHHKKSADHD